MPADSFVQAALWRRLDTPGHDACVLRRGSDGWTLSGTAVLIVDELPCQLRYEVHCDPQWRTRFAKVDGWLGSNVVNVEIIALPGERWSLNGVEQPDVAGCIDADLGFTPATNLVILRRIEFPQGHIVDAPAAWLPFPELKLERLEQQYCREDAHHYSYQAPGLGYDDTLVVDDEGFVTSYPGLWEAVGFAVQARGERKT